MEGTAEVQCGRVGGVGLPHAWYTAEPSWSRTFTSEGLETYGTVAGFSAGLLARMHRRVRSGWSDLRGTH